MKNFTLAVIRKGLPKHAFTNNLFNVGRRPLWRKGREHYHFRENWYHISENKYYVKENRYQIRENWYHVTAGANIMPFCTKSCSVLKYKNYFILNLVG